ncbi:MAG: GNAT family N-acetyltransferase [Planctomycetota bacterium]
MSQDYTIIKVASAKQIDDFFSLRRKLYRDDPAIVFPLNSIERQLLDPASHPLYEHACREMFAAYQGNQIVGRIVAIKDDLHNQHCDDQVGFFGFLEAVDDQVVFDQLISTASDWLKEKGCNRIRGPVSPSMKGEFGLVTEGFDVTPMIMLGHSLPRYVEQIQACGFESVKRFHVYRYHSIQSQEMAERWSGFEQTERRLFQRFPQLRIGEVNRQNFATTIREINHLGNIVRSEGWGFVPLTESELNFMIQNLRRIIRYDLIHVVYWEDRLIGYIVTIPDANWALKKTLGKSDLVRMLQMPFLLKRTPRCRVIALGVDPDFRKKGVATILINQLLKRHAEFKEWEFSWVDSDNLKSIRIIKRTLPLNRVRSFDLFEKAID